MGRIASATTRATRGTAVKAAPMIAFLVMVTAAWLPVPVHGHALDASGPARHHVAAVSGGTRVHPDDANWG